MDGNLLQRCEQTVEGCILWLWEAQHRASYCQRLRCVL